MSKQEPKWIFRWMKKWCERDQLEGIEGDLYELFLLEVEQFSLAKARRRHAWRAMGFLRTALLQHKNTVKYKLSNMIGNYLKISYRNALKNKTSSLVNLIGLTLGLTACGFLSQYIYQEWSYDRHFEEYDRIYRLTLDMEFGDDMTKLAISPSGFGHAIRERSPQVTDYAMLRRYSNFQFKKGNELIKTTHIYRTQADLQQVLNQQWLMGDPKEALQQPFSIVLTESLAEKLLSQTENPIGETIARDNDQQYTITGVIADPPITSHLHPEAFISLEDPQIVNQMDSWRWVTYVKVGQNFHTDQFRASLADLSSDIFGDKGGSGRGQIIIQPEKLTDIHFITDRKFELETNDGNKTYLKGFAILMALVLCMSVVNYINLTSAQTHQRLKEISVRKTFGAAKRQIMSQFFFESGLLISVATTASVLLIVAGQTIFQEYAGLDIHLTQLISWKAMAGIFGILLLIWVASGMYPAVTVSRISAFQKELKIKTNHFRNGLTLVQLALCCLVLIGTTVVYCQYQYMTSQQLGFEQEQVITTKMDNTAMKNYWVIRDELLKLPDVVSVASAEHVPGQMAPINNFEYNTADGLKKVVCPHVWADQHYLQTLRLKLLAGENFEDHRSPDGKRIGVIINESFAKNSGWTAEEAVGKVLKSGTQWEDKIIGVVQDFHFVSLHHAIEPVVIRHVVGGSHLMIKTRTNHYEELFQAVDKVWQQVVAVEQAEFSFLDKHFAAQYLKDAKRAKLFGVVSLLIIFISLAGLFGLTTYTVQRRLKEMSIRKVHGASAYQILSLMVRTYGLLSIMATIIAIPTAYYAFSGWLENFAYAITLHTWFLLVPAIGLTALILTTALIRSFKVVKINPAQILRDE